MLAGLSVVDAANIHDVFVSVCASCIHGEEWPVDCTVWCTAVVCVDELPIMSVWSALATSDVTFVVLWVMGGYFVKCSP